MRQSARLVYTTQLFSQSSTSRGMFLIRVPHQGAAGVSTESQAGVDAAPDNVRKALNTLWA